MQAGCSQNYQHRTLLHNFEQRTLLALAYVACAGDAPLLGLRLACKQVAVSFVRHDDAAVRRVFKIGGRYKRWGIWNWIESGGSGAGLLNINIAQHDIIPSNLNLANCFMIFGASHHSNLVR